MTDTSIPSETPAHEISAGDLVRSAVVFLASTIIARHGMSEHVEQALKNAEAGIAALEAQAS